MYLLKPVWNNAFWMPQREWRKLYIPDLIEGDFEDLAIWEEIVFEEIDENWEIISFKWLANFIQTSWNNIPVYIFDNHNHAFYFWWKAYLDNQISLKSTLIHIDEHSDMREANEELKIENKKLKIKKEFLNVVYEYTNNILNVGNYIKPAIESWIINEIIQVQSEWQLEDLINYKKNNSTILNLDLDFFSDEMDYIPYNKKKEIIRKISLNCQLITIATSPFFINQQKAIKTCLDIFLTK